MALEKENMMIAMQTLVLVDLSCYEQTGGCKLRLIHPRVIPSHCEPRAYGSFVRGEANKENRRPERKTSRKQKEHAKMFSVFKKERNGNHLVV